MNEQDRKAFEGIREVMVEQGQTIARIDERTANTYHLTEKLERHNAEQNGFIREQGEQIVRNTTSISRVWWLIGIVGTGGGGTGITKLLGWW